MTTKLFRNKLLRKTLSTWCAFATLATTTSPVFATAVIGGSDYNNKSGNVGIDEESLWFGTKGNVDIYLNSGSVGVIDWNTFNVNKNFTYKFNDKNVVDGATFWNIVTGMTSPSQINGVINGNNNANVFVLNPYGIAFGADSVVNVGGIFAAAAMGMTPENVELFIAQPADFDLTGKMFSGTGDITVDAAAAITAGEITLAGNGVMLNGATTGPVNIMSGDKLVVDSVGGGNVSVVFDLGESAAGDVSLMGTFTDNLTAKAAGTVMVADDITAADKNVSLTGVNWFQTSGKKITADKVTIDAKNDVAFDGKVDATTLLKVKTEGNVSQTTDIAAKKLELDTAGNVTLLDSHNVIEGVEGSAKIVLLKTDSDLAVSGLETTYGATLNAVHNDITLTGNNTATAGTLQFEAGQTIQASGSTEAQQILIGSGDLVQNGGTMKATGSDIRVAVGGKINQTAGSMSATRDVIAETKTIEQYVTAEEATASITAGRHVSGVGITQTKGADATSATITASTSINAGTGDLVQNGGTITTPEVTAANITQNNGVLHSTGDLTVNGAVTQNGGAIGAAEEGTVTFKGAVNQKFAAGGSDPAVIGRADRSNKVVFDSTFAQDGKTEGKTVAPILNAGEVEFKTAIAEDAVNGKINADKIVGDVTITLAPDEIGEGFVMDNDNVTIKAGTIGDGFTQSGGTLKAKDSSAGITFDGSVAQTGGAVISDKVTLNDTSKSENVDLSSANNEIKEVSGVAGSVKLATKEDLTVGNLETGAAGGADLTAKNGTTAKTITLDGNVTIGAGDTLTLDGAVNQTAGKVVAADKVALNDATKTQAMSLNSVNNAIKEVSGEAGSVTLVTTEALTVGDLETGAAGGADLTAKKGATTKDITFDGDVTIGAGATLNLDGANITQTDNSTFIKAAVVDFPADDVTLTGTGNEISKITGSAKNVTLNTKVDLTVEDLKVEGDTTDGNLTIVAKDTGTDTLKDITFANTGAKVNKATNIELTGDTVSQTSGAVEADKLVLNDTGAVTLDQAGNDIKEVSGSAASVAIASKSNLAIDGLDTTTLAILNGDMTITDGKTLKVDTVTVNKGTGYGTIYEEDGAIVRKSTSGTLAINANVEQKAVATKSAVIGDKTTPYDVTIAGDLTQDGVGVQQVYGDVVTVGGNLTVKSTVTDSASVIDATTMLNNNAGTISQSAGVINAKNISTSKLKTFDGGTIKTTKIDVATPAAGTSSVVVDGTAKLTSYNGTANDLMIQEAGAAGTLEVASSATTASVEDIKTLNVTDLVQKGGSVKVDKVTGNVDLDAGTLQARSTTLVLGGNVDQDGGTLGTATDEVTVKGNYDIDGNVVAKSLSVEGTAIQGAAAGTPKVQAESITTADYQLKAGSLESLTGTSDLTVNGKLTQTSGAVNNIKDLMVTDTLTQNGGAVTVTTIKGDVTQTKGDIQASTIDGNVTQKVTGTDTANIGTAGSAITFKNGNVEQDLTGITSGGASSIQGNVTLKDAGTVDVQSTDNVIATLGGNASDVTVFTASDLTLSTLNVLSLTANANGGLNDVKQSGATVVNADTLMIVNAKDVTLGNDNKIGKADITAQNDITLNQDSNIDLKVKPGTGTTTVTVNNSTTEDIKIEAVGDLTLASVAAKDVTLTGNGDITVSTSLTAKNDATVTAAGDVSVSGANVTGDAALKSTGSAKNVTLTGVNTFKDTVTLTANGDVQQTGGTTQAKEIVTDTYKLTGGNLEALSATSDLTVKGDLVQSGSSKVQNMDTLNVTGTLTQNAGDVTVTTIKGDVTQTKGTITATTIDGNVLQAASGTDTATIGSSTAPITFKNGNVKQDLTGTGTAVIQGTVVTLKDAGTVDAQSGNNAIAKLTGDASSAKVATSGAINLDALAIENNLDVAAGGNVTLSGNNTLKGTAKLGTSSGTISQVAGSKVQANVIEATNYTVAGGDLEALTTADDVTVKGNLTQNGGDIKDMATLKVVNGTFKQNGGTATLAAIDGNVEQDNVGTAKIVGNGGTGTDTITFKNGDVTQDLTAGSGTVKVEGKVVLDNAGTVDLQSDINEIGELGTAGSTKAKDVTVVTTKAIELQNLAADSLTLTAYDAAAIGTKEQKISQATGTALYLGSLEVLKAGVVDLSNAKNTSLGYDGNKIGYADITATGNVTLQQDSDVNLTIATPGTVTVAVDDPTASDIIVKSNTSDSTTDPLVIGSLSGKDVTVDGEAAVTVNALTAKDNASVTGAGDVDIKDAAVTGSASLKSTAGSVSLTKSTLANNSVGNGLAVDAKTTATVSDTTVAGGNVSIKADPTASTATAALTNLKVTNGNLDVDAGSDVTIAGTDNEFHGNAKFASANGTVTQTGGTVKANVIETDTYNMAAAATSLESLTGTGDVTVKGNLVQAGGAVQNINNLTVTDTFTQNNGTLTLKTGAGAGTLKAAVVQNETGSNSSAIDATAIEGSVTQNGGDITAASIAGNVTQNNVGTANIIGKGTPKAITFKNGDVKQTTTGTGTAKIEGNVTLDNAGELDIQSSANDIAKLGGNATKVELATVSNLELQKLEVTDLSLKAKGTSAMDITQAGSTKLTVGTLKIKEAKDVTLNKDGNEIGNTEVTAATLQLKQANDINLTADLSGTIGNTVAVDATDKASVTIKTDKDLTLDSVSGKNVTIDGDKKVTIGELNANGYDTLLSKKVGGEVSVTGGDDVTVKDVTAYDSVTLKSTGGAVSLTKATAGNTLDKSLKVDAATTATVEDTIVTGDADVVAGGAANLTTVYVGYVPPTLPATVPAKSGVSNLDVQGASVTATDVDVTGAATLKSTTAGVSLTKSAFANNEIDNGLKVDAKTTATVEDTVVAAGGADIDSVGKATLTRVTVTAGDLTVDATGAGADAELGAVTVTAGNLEVTAKNDVTLNNNITVDAGNTTVVAGGAVTQTGTGTLDFDGNVEMTAKGGDITVVKADVEGATTLKATAGDISASNADFGTNAGLTGEHVHDLIAEASGSVALSSVNVLNNGDADIDAGTTATLNTVLVHGDADVVAGGAANLTTVYVGYVPPTLPATVPAKSGVSNLDVQGASVTATDVDVTGAATLKSTTAGVSLTKSAFANNEIDNGLKVDAKTTATVEDTVVAAGGAKVDAGALVTDTVGVKNLEVTSGDVDVKAGGKITLTDKVKVDAGATTMRSTFGDIEQTETASGLGVLTLVGGDASFTADAGKVTLDKQVNVGDATHADSLVASGNGDVTVADAIVKGSVTLDSATGDIVFKTIDGTADTTTHNKVGGDFKATTAATTGGKVEVENTDVSGDATVDANTTAALDTVDVDGNLKVLAVAGITLDNAITVDGTADMKTTGAGADITQNAGSVLTVIGDTSLTADKGAVTIVKADVGATTPALVVSDFTVTAQNAVDVKDTTVTGDATLKSTDSTVNFAATAATTPNTVGGKLTVEAKNATAGTATVSDTVVTGDAKVEAGVDATLTTVTVATGDADVTAGKDVTLDDVTVVKPTPTAATGNLTAKANNGSVTLKNTVKVGGNANLTAEETAPTTVASINQASGKLEIDGNATLNAADDISIGLTAGNYIDGQLDATAGNDVDIDVIHTLKVDNITATAGSIDVDVTAVAGTPADFIMTRTTGKVEAKTASQTIDITTTEGDIVLTKVEANGTSGTVTLNAQTGTAAGKGNIEMYADGRTVNQVTANTLNLTASGDVGTAAAGTALVPAKGILLTHVNNESLNVTGNVTAENDKSLNFSASPTAAGGTDTVGGALTQTVTGGNITQSATVAVDVTGVTTLVATDDGSGTAGHIILEEIGNDFRSTVNLDTDDYVQIVDANNLKFDQVDVDGFMEAKSVSANIDQVAGTSVVDVNGRTHLEAATGITLDNAGNDFVGNVSANNTTTGNINLRDKNDINLGDNFYTGSATREDGVVSAGNVTVSTVDGDIRLNSLAATTGPGIDPSVEAANVTLSANTTTGTKGNVVQVDPTTGLQDQTIDIAPNGDAQTPVNAGLNTSVKTTGDLVMLADGSIGNGTYVTVDAGTIAADAGADASIVGIGGMDIKPTGASTITYADPTATPEAYDTVGITTGGAADLYTDGTITTKNNGGNVTTGGDVTITAADYDRTVDMTMSGSKITVYNIENTPAKNAPFDLHGGNEHPEVTATRNEVTVFADGRYVGGERKNFNRLWTLEAFQMLMPSIDVNYTVDDEGTITETTEGEE